jgi:hypothetical protein
MSWNGAFGFLSVEAIRQGRSTSWYLTDLSKAQGKQEGKTAFEGQGSRGGLAEKGLMHDLLTGKVRVKV